jgi:hypothetical protein
LILKKNKQMLNKEKYPLMSMLDDSSIGHCFIHRGYVYSILH